MACPYFDPVEPRRFADDRGTALLPLGDLWTGVCRADAEFPRCPEESALRPLCNLGYARGRCEWFPEADGPDAVRFTVAADEASGFRIWYVVERDHHPHAHGRAVFDRDGAPAESISGEVLARQARAYARSYLRRKAEASGAGPASQ